MSTPTKSHAAKKHPQPATKSGATAPDAIELLVADHKAVKTLFKQFAKLKDGDGGNEEKSALVQRICAELTVHATIEEEIFYPAVREAIDDDDLVDEAEVEHASAKELIAQLAAASPDDDQYDAKVTVLGELIDHHVEEEEDEMFPQARKKIDVAAVGAELAERKAELSEAGDAESDVPARGVAKGASARGAKRAAS